MELNSVTTICGRIISKDSSIAQWCLDSNADCVQCEVLQGRIHFLENKEEECKILQSRVEFLEQKISLLEDIALASDVISAMSHSLTVNPSINRTVSNQFFDVGVQTDSIIDNDQFKNSNSNLEFDSIQNVPESFLLLDHDGLVEAPSSILSNEHDIQDYNDSPQDSCPYASSGTGTINTSNVFWGPRIRESNYYRELAVSPVSSCTEEIALSSNSVSCSEVTCNTQIQSSIPEHIKPIELIDDCPFSKFSSEELLKELNFSHKFSNRLVTYYGKYPYHYSGGIHPPQDIPGGSHLDKLCCYLGVILPDFQYNSVLINLYRDGNDYIPAHSDSEPCIVQDSQILTVSLGSSRDMRITDSSGAVACSVTLHHGSLCAMSKASQSFFKHETVPDPCSTGHRVSLTFRQIKPWNESPAIEQGDSNACGYVPYATNSINSTGAQRPPPSATLPSADHHPKRCEDRTSVLYVSSSMFRYISEGKLSSPTIKASKLCYPGADAAAMLSKLKQDLPKLDTKPADIYLMTGTNNVDPIYYGKNSLENAMKDISKLFDFLKVSYPSANIYVINILPRHSLGRNDVVTELNRMIESYCAINGFDFMNCKHLFKSYHRGCRNNAYFMPPNRYYDDNCHLNKEGVKRLGKYLKYWSHEQLRS